ncbi:MAG: PilZ domain-containing protein [PVC group bacterium]|nr:PilZ domain-containing protein [PVC group bacterium]
MDENIHYHPKGEDTGERRKFLRINANFVVSYHEHPGKVNNTDMTLTRNISLGGICFTSDKDFELGAILKIILRLPKVTKQIEFLGAVVSTKQENGKNSIFDIGVKFVEAEEEDLYILQNILKECASSGNKNNLIISIEEKSEKEKKDEDS